ncbi:hypothetical protein B0H13DRAFT_1923667 [Mycena leptocephala]|nr:hypothetical protein B0H13DRAFT_1923667 [Mycena leptocephala]
MAIINSSGNADEGTDPAIKDIEAAPAQVLNELVDVGALQQKNLVDIEDLIHMPEEQVIEDTTDEDIFEAVQKIRNSEQDREKNGSDEWEKYIADLDDPLARKMVAMLSKFGCETHREEAIAMVDTVTIDYFAQRTSSQLRNSYKPSMSLGIKIEVAESWSRHSLQNLRESFVNLNHHCELEEFSGQSFWISKTTISSVTEWME